MEYFLFLIRQHLWFHVWEVAWITQKAFSNPESASLLVSKFIIILKLRHKVSVTSNTTTQVVPVHGTVTDRWIAISHESNTPDVSKSPLLVKFFLSIEHYRTTWYQLVSFPFCCFNWGLVISYDIWMCSEWNGIWTTMRVYVQFFHFLRSIFNNLN